MTAVVTQCTAKFNGYYGISVANGSTVADCAAGDNIDNGISLCRPHHTLVHNGWTPTRDADGQWYLEPP